VTTKRLLGLAVVLACAVDPAWAGKVGQWNESLRAWNTPEMSVVVEAVRARRHVVEAPGAIDAAGLAHLDAMVIGEPKRAPSGDEAAALAAFVRGGGVLILLGDTGGTGELNGILGSIGSALSFSGNPPANAALSPGAPATDGPPYALAGQSLAVSTGLAVTGGLALAGTYARYERLDAGIVYAFGDRVDHNSLAADAGSVNSRLFVNALAPTLAAVPTPVPGLSPFAVVLLGGAVVLAVARSRRARVRDTKRP
jgi:hypothetical protein